MGAVLKRLAFLFAQHEQIQAFYFVAGPWRFAKKFQARIHAGVVREAANWDANSQLIPAKIIGQLRDHGFEGDAVQRVAGLFRVWRHGGHRGAFKSRKRGCAELLCQRFRDFDAVYPGRQNAAGITGTFTGRVQALRVGALVIVAPRNAQRR